MSDIKHEVRAILHKEYAYWYKARLATENPEEKDCLQCAEAAIEHCIELIKEL